MLVERGEGGKYSTVTINPMCIIIVLCILVSLFEVLTKSKAAKKEI